MSVIPDVGYTMQCAIKAKAMADDIADTVKTNDTGELTAIEFYNAIDKAINDCAALMNQLIPLRRETVHVAFVQAPSRAS